MAERMSRLVMPRDVLQERPLVVPVPLSPQKLRERGYNQSELLARGICRRWDLELIVDSVRRTRSTTTQTRLSPDERKVNVAGAFAVLPEREVQLAGSHLLLVDDVVTTGATLNSCSDALFAAGARIISYITFGRARASGDL